MSKGHQLLIYIFSLQFNINGHHIFDNFQLFKKEKNTHTHTNYVFLPIANETHIPSNNNQLEESRIVIMSNFKLLKKNKLLSKYLSNYMSKYLSKYLSN